jgi:hypothetical protein
VFNLSARSVYVQGKRPLYRSGRSPGGGGESRFGRCDEKSPSPVVNRTPVVKHVAESIIVSLILNSNTICYYKPSRYNKFPFFE